MENTTLIQAKEMKFSNAELTKATRLIVRETEKAGKSLVAIAMTLRKIDDEKLYVEDGFKDVVDYGKTVFGYGKTAVYGMIGVARKFIADTGVSILTHGANDYTVRQMQELLPITVEEAQELDENGDITPDSTIAEIKKAVKKLKTADEVSEESTESDDESIEDNSEDDVVELDRESAIQYSAITALNDLKGLLEEKGDTCNAEVVADMIKSVEAICKVFD